MSFLVPYVGPMTDNQKIVKLAAHTGMVPRTVRKWWQDEKVSPSVSFACERAAQELAFVRPCDKG